MIEDEPGRKINVIFGGGRQCLVSNVTDSPEDPIDRWSCYSTDGRDLIHDWTVDKQKRNFRHAVVTNNEELENLDHAKTDYALGTLYASKSAHFKNVFLLNKFYFKKSISTV